MFKKNSIKGLKCGRIKVRGVRILHISNIGAHSCTYRLHGGINPNMSFLSHKGKKSLLKREKMLPTTEAETQEKEPPKRRSKTLQHGEE